MADEIEVRQEYYDNIGTGIESEGSDDEDLGEIIQPWDPKKIRVDPKIFSVRQVMDMIDNNELDLAPDFQRLKVWTPQQKSKLIESIFLRIPLPAFYFASDEEGKMQVVDGVQRLHAIHQFYKGFRLTGMEYLTELKNKSYASINDSMWKRRFEMTQLQVNVIDPQTPEPVKFDIFRRINTGGTPLSAQEIRHCLSKPRAREFLHKMSTCEAYHNATGKVLKDHTRMADREFALRFCAFKFWRDNCVPYNNTMLPITNRNITDEALDEINRMLGDPAKMSDKMLITMYAGFKLAMENACKIFGANSFRKNNSAPLNKALFDCLSVELSYCDPQKIQSNSQIIAANLQSLIMNDSEFYYAISLSTGNQKKVNYRFTAIHKLLKEYANA